MNDLPFNQNDNPRLGDPWRSIVNLFHNKAAAVPAAFAIEFYAYGSSQPETLTYAELNSRANQLAHHLIALGIGPDQFVGISLPRSLDLPIAVLAVLKTGAAYVPIDPNYPAKRITFMLEDAQPNLILTHTSINQDFGKHSFALA